MAFRALRPGDRVALIAPAGPAEPADVAKVPALLARHGLRAVLHPSCHARRGFLAGDDAQRAADLHAAFADPQAAAVWCLRGGHGSTRLLPRLDVAALQRGPKLLIGYSDITALHCVLGAAGLPGLHAPMPTSDLIRPGRDDDAGRLFALLRDGAPAGTQWQAPPAPVLHRPGVAEGRLLGGNLAMLCALLGTPWQPDTRGALLFLEDVNEDAYRIDRMLVQLGQAGLLAGAAGFLLGSFTGGDTDAGAVLAEHLLPLGRPLLAGWPAGHGTPHWPLPLGLPARLDAGAGTLTLQQDFILA